MEKQDRISAVSRMQSYMAEHLNEEITLEALGEAAGYSKYHAARVFKELTGLTPFQAIRALRLTQGAAALQQPREKVVDAALASGFDSHEGFTRAFARRFAINPQDYRRKTPAVAWFTAYPIEAYYQLKEGKSMGKVSTPAIVTVTPVERPPRKLILKRIVRATDYLSMCEEVGCDWEGLFNSIPEKLDTFCGCDLPPRLVAPGTGPHAFGVEVPADYDKPIPAGCDAIDLPACTLLFFQSAPYEREADFGMAYESVYAAVAAYQPERYGWQFAPELGPKCTFAAKPTTGARQAVPVKPIGQPGAKE